MSTPHTCPVCGGRGTVLQGFYNHYGYYHSSSMQGVETCRTCGGRGIIWETDHNDPPYEYSAPKTTAGEE
jgi:hypothetical protein